VLAAAAFDFASPALAPDASFAPQPPVLVPKILLSTPESWEVPLAPPPAFAEVWEALLAGAAPRTDDFAACRAGGAAGAAAWGTLLCAAAGAGAATTAEPAFSVQPVSTTFFLALRSAAECVFTKFWAFAALLLGRQPTAPL
jgi:hypothetical protein